MPELTENQIAEGVKFYVEAAGEVMEDLRAAAERGASPDEVGGLAHLYTALMLQSERAGISGEITLAMQNINRAIREQRLRGRKVEQVYDLMKFQFEQVGQHVLHNFLEMNAALREVLGESDEEPSGS